MNYKEIPNFECPNEQCWLRDGEHCKLDLALFKELESNDTLRNQQCMDSFFTMHKIRRYLEQNTVQKPERAKEFADYKAYKEKLDTELRKTTEGFVRIGYLLKVAKDTDILKESGYANVYEFAQAEYNIEKSQVSRFMSINDRFSEGGYSDRLKEEFRGFGHAKLTIMLQLPDEINEELSPDFTKSEIQAIREEYDAEQTITDIEVLIEGEDPQQKSMDNNLYKVMHQLGKEEPEWYVKMFEASKQSLIDIQEMLAPDGEKIFDVRIMGVGKLMLSVKDLDRPITITNMRSMEKESFTWETMQGVIAQLTPGEDAQKAWEALYSQEFPQKPEVAPVQPKPAKKEASKKEPPKKESKVKKAKKPQPKPKEPEKEPEEQIPGQDNVMNHPEYLPEEMQETAERQNAEPLEGAHEAAVVEETIENITEQAEIVEKIPVEEPEKLIKTKCETDLAQPAAVKELPAKDEKTIWSDMELNAAKLNLFVQDYKGDRHSVPKDRLKAAYQNAISLAADIEQLLNRP